MRMITREYTRMKQVHVTNIYMNPCHNKLRAYLNTLKGKKKITCCLIYKNLKSKIF